MLIVISGMLATGKTSLATSLSERLGLPALHLDEFKRRIVAQHPSIRAHLRAGEPVPRTYLDQVFELARARLVRLSARHTGCIVEEVFAHEDDAIELARSLADQFPSGTFLIHTTAAPDAIMERLHQRDTSGTHLVGSRYYPTMDAAMEPRTLVQLRYPTDRPQDVRQRQFDALVAVLEGLMRLHALARDPSPSTTSPQ